MEYDTDEELIKIAMRSRNLPEMKAEILKLTPYPYCSRCGADLPDPPEYRCECLMMITMSYFCSEACYNDHLQDPDAHDPELGGMLEGLWQTQVN